MDAGTEEDVRVAQRQAGDVVGKRAVPAAEEFGVEIIHRHVARGGGADGHFGGEQATASRGIGDEQADGVSLVEVKCVHDAFAFGGNLAIAVEVPHDLASADP